jgi:glyoxylase-like metal-dependent hydrolase (beta-lactamase superfamily II)
MRYQWAILQDGQLPLKVDGRVTREQHLCTVTLIWPRAASPSRDNSLIVDPCFSTDTIGEAEARLQQLDASLDSIGYYFETHGHFDHQVHVPRPPSLGRSMRLTRQLAPKWNLWSGDTEAFRGIDMVTCPGHATDLRVLSFRGARGVVCVASDAILNREWLLAWQYYWPNVYEPAEIVETWQSLARILASADTVIPGHGPPIAVNAELLRELIDNLPRAEYGSRCAEIVGVLNQRLEKVR